MEEPELFAQAHRLVFDLVRQGVVSGLRIDHVDGLFDPAEYCRMVLAGVGPVWLVVEKILAHHEALRRDWPVAGTTGYDFLNEVGGLFVAGDAEATLTATYEAFTGVSADFEREVIQSKKRIIDEHMTSELRVLAGRLGRIAASHWRSRDFTLSLLYSALEQVVACLPVYRTYITSRRVTENDRRYIGWAVARARKLAGGDPSVFDFVAGVLDTSLGRDLYSRRAVVDFAMRLQQYSGPVMAKGFEDTALYRYNRLVALNEVGGDPRRFGVSASAFHQIMRGRARTHPHAMLATATHDTKRGEDVRVRISVLSEIPEAWHQHVERWSRLNAPFRKQLDGGPAPEPNDEFFLYQTMLGAWPVDADRLAACAVKSVKEAKRRTSWGRPDEDYESAVADFVRRICETDRRNPFLEDFLPLQRRCAQAGMVNGLAQTLLKLTCPGVPDFYQGSELWQLALVDPDNRRPVDYDARRGLLGTLAGQPLPAGVEDWADGAVKQELIRRVLALRRAQPLLFEQGAYHPLPVRGGGGGHCLAFARHHQDEVAVVAVPLLVARLWQMGARRPPLAEDWRGTYVETPRRPVVERWRNLFTGEEIGAVARRGTPVIHVPELFRVFPLALLVPLAN